MSKHLTAEQRYTIYAFHKSGNSTKLIAQEVGKSQRTVQRELTRNRGLKGYRPKQAQRLAESRRRNLKPRLLKMTPETVALIEEKLALQWSPEQISGWFKKHHPTQAVSHERIYQQIWQDKRGGGHLYKHLRRQGKKYFKRSNGKPFSEEGAHGGDLFPPWNEGLYPRSGAKRPEWVTVVERKSRYTKVVRVTRATAEQVSMALSQCLQGLPTKTITFDNGKEFAYHLAVAKALDAETYFAQPYHSWERELNENTNGLIRQYFPKGTNFDTVSDEEVAKVEALLNTRPRKCLGYDTPEGVLMRAA